MCVYMCVYIYVFVCVCVYVCVCVCVCVREVGGYGYCLLQFFLRNSFFSCLRYVCCKCMPQ